MKHELSYSNAGHNPPLHWDSRAGRVRRLTPTGPALGIMQDPPFTSRTLDFAPGDMLVMYTDGLVHAGKRRGMPMDVGAMLRSVLEDQDPTPQALADALLAQAVSLDDDRPADDISVLVLKVTPLSGDNVRRMAVRLPLDGVARLS